MILKEKIISLFSLSDDQAEREEIDKRLADGAVVRGSNLYVLIFAILIASIGLNVNSTAVVIGAMLISPLMGFIINFAYGIASQDFARARNSLWKLGFLVLASIITSSIYFKISPLGTFSSELLARTTPTFWDVLIAFFGGFSAIIAITRKGSFNNVIPGAAIATALMPPLCTVGYCLAHTEWLRAVGAFYLFTINAVFICLSSILGLYIMKIVGLKELFDTRRERRFFILTMLIAIIPSTIMAGVTVRQDQVNRNFKTFLMEEFSQFENTEIVKADIDMTDKKSEVFLMGNPVDEKSIETIKSHLCNYGLDKYDFTVVQTNVTGGISKDELDSVLNGSGFMDKESVENAKQNKKMLDMYKSSEEQKTGVSKEVLTLYPNVQKAGFAESVNRDDETELELIIEVIENLKDDELINMENWLHERFNKDVNVKQLEISNR